jgi:GLPGLI family protein
MKKVILLILFFISMPTSFSQTLRGIYINQTLEGVGDDSKLSEASKIPKVYEYIFHDNKSSQKLINGRGTTVDTLIQKYEKYDILVESTIKSIGISKSTIIKDFKANTYLRNFESDGTETYTQEPIPLYEWTITNETKMINGFNCKKATTNMNTGRRIFNVEAWFCEDVPINDGPISLNGLPGFIFEASSGKIFNFKFKNFTFSETEKTIIEPIKTVVKLEVLKN